MRRFLFGVVAIAAALVGFGATASPAGAITYTIEPSDQLMVGASVLEPNRDGSTTLLGVEVEASRKAADSITVTGSVSSVPSDPTAGTPGRTKLNITVAS